MATMLARPPRSDHRFAVRTRHAGRWARPGDGPPPQAVRCRPDGDQRPAGQSPMTAAPPAGRASAYRDDVIKATGLLQRPLQRSFQSVRRRS